MTALFAPAKLNLTLRVGPPQTDGRHPLDSLVCFTHGLGDHLRVEAAPDLRIEITGPFSKGLSAGPDNLVFRAARILADAAGVPTRAHLHLIKNLPIASGIGGGSADAAAAMHALNEFWNLNLLQAELLVLGAQLGADVPACLIGQPVHMTGTGETLAHTGPLAAMGVVLINPGVPCPTGPVYRTYDALGSGPILSVQPLPDISSRENLLAYLQAMPNDLEQAAISLVPEIAEAMSCLAASPNVRFVRMSGSGATCFALYDHEEAAQAGKNFVLKGLANRGFWVEADRI
ncbi:MAG: 4-(cytidine 5'-diphospho)-2-C-methyl-D-erythritol kinase [Hyphomonadaceae bacterium]|jgi:4-diphosphocytidyl-2-C-methyl-D-erythritol kinase|uniref:4-(cytidine 5'-diphospho)-2-C-methyl-D-erythritol kinase n=1 Tax=Aquidulcibacter sp. TaxID=2052990 RepID=UPI0022CBBD0B|nr:4-(cytidine 5'-diphospho)-2-C-methyl-D-erythritol kinase [Aquidulcibacter sp.]MCE2892460.1 4-(cytidine 5'-diphospho)-2-C-methyl-D-erythritol kinase [Hyphomonadaceae bacterium]MCZ8206660.1 4-(cytidine 5'-diphospho)-2-C-methyl-D-erythritol kinase [Aquidulcibacter sp.]